MANSSFVQGLIDDELLASDVDEEVKKALDDMDSRSQAGLRAALEQVQEYMDPRLGFVFI